MRNPEDVTLESIANNKARFINAQPGREAGTGMECFILENRQKTTWTPSRMGSGMLVIHVDYDANQWVMNTLNNDPDHQRMAFVPADGVKEGVQTSAEL